MRVRAKFHASNLFDQRKSLLFHIQRLQMNSHDLKEKYIARYKQYQLQIQELSKEIETLEKDPLEHKDKILDKIDELYDTKLEMKKM